VPDYIQPKKRIRKTKYWSKENIQNEGKRSSKVNNGGRQTQSYNIYIIEVPLRRQDRSCKEIPREN
jgi:hypothetical protein